MDKHQNWRFAITLKLFLILPFGLVKAQNVGIGTSSPQARLQIIGGSDASLVPTSGYLLLGPPSGLNLVFDENEILARNNGEASSLYLNIEGGNILLGPGGNSRVGIGINSPLSRLHIAVGTDANFNQTSGYLMIGAINEPNIVMDNNEILARNNGRGSELYLNIDSGDVVVSPNGQGNLRIGANNLAGSKLWLNRSPGLATFDMLGGNGNLDGSEGDFRIGNSTQRLKIGVLTSGPNAGYSRIRTAGTNAKLILGVNNMDVIAISAANNGNVVIGNLGNIEDAANSYKLSVQGKIACTELMVKSVAAWPDYVFEENYALPDLKELKDFIATHGHLPDIPSAGEVARDGIVVGEMQHKLLKKIEELTLYLLLQEDRIKRLEARK